MKLFRILLNVLLGAMLILGGIDKFKGPERLPTEIVDQVKKGEQVAPSVEILKIKNFIFGMKQSGFFWEFLGVMEILAGMLLLSQVFALFGAILALPMIVNIFLFHLFLEPHELPDLMKVTGLLVANLILLGLGYPKWKPLLYQPETLRLR